MAPAAHRLALRAPESAQLLRRAERRLRLRLRLHPEVEVFRRVSSAGAIAHRPRPTSAMGFNTDQKMAESRL